MILKYARPRDGMDTYGWCFFYGITSEYCTSDTWIYNHWSNVWPSYNCIGPLVLNQRYEVLLLKLSYMNVDTWCWHITCLGVDKRGLDMWPRWWWLQGLSNGDNSKLVGGWAINPQKHLRQLGLIIAAPLDTNTSISMILEYCTSMYKYIYNIDILYIYIEIVYSINIYNLYNYN